MKISLKDLQKAIDRATKDAAITVNLEADDRLQKLRISYYDLAGLQTVIELGAENSELFNYITKTERF